MSRSSSKLSALCVSAVKNHPYFKSTLAIDVWPKVRFVKGSEGAAGWHQLVDLATFFFGIFYIQYKVNRLT